MIVTSDAASNFSLKDPLFELKEPVDEIKSDEDNTCSQCTKPFNKKTRKFWYYKTSNEIGSKFCGRAHYNDCIKETRAFASNKKKRYPICDSCSMKFFVKQLYDEYSDKIAEKDGQIKQFSAEFRNNLKQYTELKTCYYQKKRDVLTERKRLEDSIKDLEINLANIKKEHVQLAEEQEKLTGDTNEATKSQKDLENRFTEQDSKLQDLYDCSDGLFSED